LRIRRWGKEVRWTPRKFLGKQARLDWMVICWPMAFNYSLLL
jgi:hypothetical protein